MNKIMMYMSIILVCKDRVFNRSAWLYFLIHKNKLENRICYEVKPELVFISLRIALPSWLLDVRSVSFHYLIAWWMFVRFFPGGLVRSETLMLNAHLDHPPHLFLWPGWFGTIFEQQLDKCLHTMIYQWYSS